MSTNIEEQKSAFVDFFKAMEKLKGLGILTNKKDFTGQIGEWLVECIYEGKRAKSCIQKGWDIDVNGTHIQVKTHAKAETNPSRRTTINEKSSEKINELIIVVFTHDFKLKEFYRVPWRIALSLTKNSRISWNYIEKYSVKLKSLPHQEIITLFE